MTKKSYSTLTIAAAAAVLILLAGGAALAEHSSEPTAVEFDQAVELRVIEAPMCFLPRFTAAEHKRCSVVGYIIRPVAAAL